MRLGIIGLPQSGKTTIFNALTHGDAPVAISGGRVEVRTAIINVPDDRVSQLEAIFNPKKTTYAQVTYADITGLDGGNGKSGISGQLLNQITQMDGLIHVVRCFESASVPHSAGSLDPVRDIASMDAELMLNDMISIGRKLEKLEDEKKRAKVSDRQSVEKETLLFERLAEALNQQIPLRDLKIEPEDIQLLSGFGLLTMKPLLILLNLGDDQQAPAIEYDHRLSSVLPIQGRLEMDLAQLRTEEVQQFMLEFSIERLGLDRVIQNSYNLLGLQSFYTVGEDEVRAWTIRRGASALEASGVIHTDLQKGFIRAEVLDYQTLIELGGINDARTQGKLRLEGKNYELKDGEIMHVRFNV